MWGVPMMNMMSGMMGGMMWMGVLWLTIVVLLVAGVVWLVRRTSQGGGAQEDGGMQVLRERFARGEIDEEEYRSRRRELRS